jgi:hypothetical protein
MKLTFLLLVAGFLLRADGLHVTVEGVTPQQAILHIDAPDNGGCSVQASESKDFAPLARDVDPALFPGSDRCGREIQLTKDRQYVFVLGARGVGDATDGTIKSRSLQVDTTYYVKVSMASGATSTVSVRTKNRPLGDSSPDYIPYDPKGYGGWGWPTIDYSPQGITTKYIDPLTGLQLQRMTDPSDEPPRIDAAHQSFFSEDLSGGKWTLPANAEAGQPPQHLHHFDYSGAGGSGDAIFLRFKSVPHVNGESGYNQSGAIEDILLNLHGSGDPVMACVTYDHGQSCLGQPIEMRWGHNGWAASDSRYPDPLFRAWGSPRFLPSMEKIGTGNVSIEGTKVKVTGGDLFPVEVMKPGDILQFFQSNYTNYTDFYKVASVQSPTELTLEKAVTNVPKPTMYQITSFGVKIWKVPGTQGSVRIDAANYSMSLAYNFGTEDQGQGATGCGPAVQVTRDMNGRPLNPPLTGYICTFVDGGGNQIQKLWTPSNRQIWKLSLKTIEHAESGKEKPDYFGYNGGYLQRCYYDLAKSAVGCTPIQTRKTITQEIESAHPEIDLQYYGGLSFRGGTHPYFLFTSQPQQNTAYWACVVDVSKPVGREQVQHCHNSWSGYPLRWQTSHSQKADFINGNYVEAFQNFAMSYPGLTASGLWTLRVLKLYSDGVHDKAAENTALTNEFHDPNTCAALGVTNKQWITEGEKGEGSCIKINVAGEPVNANPPKEDLTPLGHFPVGSKPGPWPHNAKSCGGDGSTDRCWSYLQPMEEGDWLGDLAATQGEKFIIAKKTPLHDGTFDLVLVRNPRVFGEANGVQAHAAGWTAMLTPPNLPGTSCGGVYYSLLGQPFTASNWIEDSPYVWCAHHATWQAGGKEIHIGVQAGYAGARTLPDSLGGYYSGYGIRYGVVPEVWGKPIQYVQQGQYPFAGSFNGTTTPFQQTHPGGDTWDAPAREQVWGLDGRPYGPASGSTYASKLWRYKYELVSGRSSTYRISPPEGDDGKVIFENSSHGAKWTADFDPKRRMTQAWAGFHLLRNISGPKSQISDKTPFTWCRALERGECVGQSAPGETFVSVPMAFIDGSCYSGSGEATAPCLTPAGPEMAEYEQFGVNEWDPYGKLWRRLTMAFDGPGRTNNYANMHGKSTGDYGFTATMWADGRRSDVMAVKLPPWPTPDSLARNSFLPLKVAVSAEPNSYARIEFGYAEYGADEKGAPLFCSAERMERCAAPTSAGSREPYLWESEPAAWTPCSGGCTVTVPALSGRVLYYRIQRRANGTVTSGALTMKATD